MVARELETSLAEVAFHESVEYAEIQRFDDSVARLPPSTADAAVEQAPATRALATPSGRRDGIEQGHGPDSWGRSDSPEREDFEPRYSPDTGTFAERPPAAAEASRPLH